MDHIPNYTPEIKKFLGWATTPLLVGVILSSFTFAFWYGVSTWKTVHDKTAVRQISVTGEGKVAVKPDLAIFTAGVITDAVKVKDAQLENTRRSNAMLGFLKQKGLEEKDVKTVGYSIYPQYSYPEPCPRGLPGYENYPCPPDKLPKIKNYQVRHIIEIKVRDLDKSDEFLEGVVTNGANEIGSVSFSVEDEEKIKIGARKKAIENAKEKASVLAKDLGVRLGKLTNFSEFGGEIPIFTRNISAMSKESGSPTAPSPEVAPGEQEIKSLVNITFEFK